MLLAISICVCVGLKAQMDKKVCKLEIYDMESNTRKVLKEFPFLIEAPNWTKDGKYLIYNSKGKLYKIEIANTENIMEINTGFATNCNNDHVLSASGKRIAVSHGTKEDGRSRIYILPVVGGNPILITPMAPSYLHGWSPDEKTLAYCAERNGEYDIYTISSEGGVEKQLTDSKGLDDGPEYCAQGNHIWFNSSRTGLMQIWRMNNDGTEQRQITGENDRNSWFPHISPDEQWIVYLSYKKEDVEPSAHPFGKNVELRLMSVNDYKPKTIVHLFGGQGTINVNSWSPDSKYFAFVSYNE
jgi:Tol biopolymer transport system component